MKTTCSMRIILHTTFLLALTWGTLLGILRCSADEGKPRVLLFTKTEFVFHESSAPAVDALKQLCRENGLAVDVTDDSDDITEENLCKYAAIVFLNTNGDILNPDQEALFERYLQAGGGFVGIHTAIDTEHSWKWYTGLAGCTVEGESEVLASVLTPVDTGHVSTKHLEDTWQREDTWFNIGFLDPGIRVLLTRTSPSSGDVPIGSFDPVSWYHEYDGGRAFITTMGHTPESYSDPVFLQHLLGGIQYAVGENKPIKLQARQKEEPVMRSGFVKTVLADNLYEPMELDIFPDGKVLFIERRGDFQLFDPVTGKIRTIGHIPVFIENELGLLGVAIDPNWEQNHWIYVYYAPEGDEPVNVLSRFVCTSDGLNPDSEKILITIPVQRDECCHQGGCVEFDANGYLYLSTGDNSSPYDNDGFAPIDERPGRSPWDAQKSSANTADLRGKILRIKPLPDGSYVCPAGNLFTGTDVVVSADYRMLLQDPLLQDLVRPATADTSTRYDFPFLKGNRASGAGGAPEIYVMGCRNPFRISVDSRRNYVFWGDVGPDAGEDDPKRGAAGHDEINRAREAGFFGWPYFVGDNKPYVEYDFERKTSGKPYDRQRPVNNSPNNTGAYYLPPAQPAFIWYPFANSAEFPLVTNGTRCAMAGPVYYTDQYPEESRFPDQWNGKLLIYEWMRGWIRAVSLDSLGNYSGMERFADSVRWSRPIDMCIDKTGALWVLEYGTEWYHSNPDARLSRLDYIRGNPGDSTAVAGNQPPEISWDLGRHNRSFYQPGDVVQYRVLVSDREDGSLRDGGIVASAVDISISRLTAGPGIAAYQPGTTPAKARKNPYDHGKALIEGSDCKACHAQDKQINGPSYAAIAQRYETDKSARKVLAEKIIKGGTGNWGHTPMSAHPQISSGDATDMVQWILSLNDPAYRQPPLQGVYPLQVPENAGGNSVFVFRASYQDQAWGDAPSNTTTSRLILRPPLQEAEWADSLTTTTRKVRRTLNDTPATLLEFKHEAAACFKYIDLTGVSSVELGVIAAEGSTGSAIIELRLDSPEGPLAGSAPVPPVQAVAKGSLSTVTLQL
ncbi:MAG: c-type cytochrome, partial [Bacteroidetes bacterium]